VAPDPVPRTPGDLFVLRPSEDDRYLRAAIVSIGGARLDGRIERAIATGLATPPGPVSCVTTSGLEPPDVLGNARQLPIVSVRVADALRKVGATGVSFYPVQVTTKNAGDLSYAGMILNGRGGALATESGADLELATGLFVRSTLNVNGLRIDPAAWDGSDVFHVPEFPLIPILTARVIEAIGELHPKGLTIVPAAEFRP
jgi:hypothetical protein